MNLPPITRAELRCFKWRLILIASLSAAPLLACIALALIYGGYEYIPYFATGILSILGINLYLAAAIAALGEGAEHRGKRLRLLMTLPQPVGRIWGEFLLSKLIMVGLPVTGAWITMLLVHIEDLGDVFIKLASGFSSFFLTLAALIYLNRGLEGHSKAWKWGIIGWDVLIVAQYTWHIVEGVIIGFEKPNVDQTAANFAMIALRQWGATAISAALCYFAFMKRRSWVMR